jgi:hypothetical protein
MSRYAIIDGGRVTNVVLCGDEFLPTLSEGHDLVLDIENVQPAPGIGWAYTNGVFSAPPPDIPKLINRKLESYQLVAPILLRDLYTANTLAGLTVAQSDQMFDDFADVLIRIREGAFPTALYRLAQKQPIGAVTQPMIDSWTAKVKAYL